MTLHTMILQSLTFFLALPSYPYRNQLAFPNSGPGFRFTLEQLSLGFFFTFTCNA